MDGGSDLQVLLTVAEDPQEHSGGGASGFMSLSFIESCSVIAVANLLHSLVQGV